MSTTDVVRQMEADDLARAKTMTEMILQDWDLMTWNELPPTTSCCRSSWVQLASIVSGISAASVETCKFPAAKMPNAC